MIDLEFPKQQTAGAIDSEPKTVTGLAAKETLTPGELLEAAFPANRISAC